ncbi:unnamed protein product (macronuclear) [Paramecium tetraurelia]|uniref:Uncharacterized protein n=1 Tax=Paramecium tetraurelia TaxID=5888 RepID=A0CZU5_PARTE|nr:uncharacterized protein GSPATT00011885001 [Paramecium tetraurelia]CAK76312.1 unnamed protein product [Paramecium tetraurelia]|eukprot:XP_001443709.1 hypothetical protein (macronuclear) [Paramecium tetraurelia strain d4-2]
MSQTRTSQSSKHQRKGDNRFLQQINSLLQNVSNPPLNISKRWIKDREGEQKSLFEEVKQNEFTGKSQTLTQLTDIGKKLAKMKKKLRTFTADDRLKTPVSENKSRKSTKSKKSQSKKGQSSHSQSRTQLKSLEQSRSKSSKKAKKPLKSSKTQNTPKFKKKTFENKLGSFSKEMQQQRDSSRPNVRILESRIAKNTVDRSSSPSRSIGSSKKQVRNRRTESPCEESSSLTDSSDTKEIMKLKMNPTYAQSKYEVFMDNEKKIKELDAGQLSREENLMLTTKLESVTKEKLLREYRILYYRSKEVKKLLTEYYEQNLRLTEEINELQQIIYDKQLENKQVKKELKSQTKEMKIMQSEYSTKLDQLGKSYQQHEMNTVPLNDYERLKQENDKILIENEMLKEDYKGISLKMQQIENEIYQKRQYEIPEQEISQRLQRELESVRDQADRIKEENMKLKLQLDKEQISNRELSQQIYQKKNELDGNVEQKQYELTSLKSHLQTANTKIQKLEQQITQMKYQMISEQEQSFSIREKIIRQEEELRIANLKVENREKEINEQRSKELILKKKILDLESKIENQFQQSQPYFEPIVTINKPINSDSFINKELQVERQLLAKTQEQLQNIQGENDQLKRNLKQIELELQYERQQNEQIKLKFTQLQQENEFTLQRAQKQFEETENHRSKEFQLTEQQYKNQENLLFSAQQRINELENELRILQNKELENKNSINDQKLQIEKQQLKLEQNLTKVNEFQNQIKTLEYENAQLSENNRQLKVQSQQLTKELEQIDRIKDNYKNKYLNNRYENKKLLNQYNEKENIMKQTFTNELEKVKCQKEQLEKIKSQEECQRQQKDKKLKVINDLQQMIKGHKMALDK